MNVDGKDLSDIPIEVLRSCIVAETENICFFEVSIKDNLDPGSLLPHCTINDVLKAVGLHEVVQAMGGLNTPFSRELFSASQQQAFALARSVLRHSKLYLLDLPLAL